MYRIRQKIRKRKRREQGLEIDVLKKTECDPESKLEEK